MLLMESILRLILAVRSMLNGKNDGVIQGLAIYSEYAKKEELADRQAIYLGAGTGLGTALFNLDAKGNIIIDTISDAHFQHDTGLGGFLDDTIFQSGKHPSEELSVILTRKIKLVNPKQDFDRLVRGEEVEVFINGTIQKVKGITDNGKIIIKMDCDDDRVASCIGGKYLDANGIGILMVYYHLSKLFEKLSETTNPQDISKIKKEYARFIKNGIFKVKIGRTIASTEMIDKVLNYWEEKFKKLEQNRLSAFGITGFTFELDEVAVGFKNFAAHDSEYLVCFESSSHLADYKTGMKSKDDGLAIGLRTLEMQAYYNKNLVDVISEIAQEIGYKKEFRELAVDYGGSPKYEETRDMLKDKGRIKDLVENLGKLLEKSGSNLKIDRIKTIDGLKVIFSDGSSVLVRVSGTERKGRLYIQAEPARISFFKQLGEFLLGQKISDQLSVMLIDFSKLLGLGLNQDACQKLLEIVRETMQKPATDYPNLESTALVLKAA